MHIMHYAHYALCTLCIMHIMHYAHYVLCTLCIMHILLVSVPGLPLSLPPTWQGLRLSRLVIPGSSRGLVSSRCWRLGSSFVSGYPLILWLSRSWCCVVPFFICFVFLEILPSLVFVFSIAFWSPFFLPDRSSSLVHVSSHQQVFLT